jgi:Uma2 family endonuclease
MGAADLLDALQPSRHRWSAAQYQRLGETGVLGPEVRTELIDGEILKMAPIGTRHASTVSMLARLCERAVGDRALVWVQNPLRLGDMSEPEPDLMLLKPRSDFYAHAHPAATDVLLLVEVADTTLRYDTEIKLPLYARHGVAEVWVLDLAGGVLQRHRQPAGGRYAHGELLAQPGAIDLPLPPGGRLDVSGLLPAPAGG